jgi:hypothetical protein
MHVSFGSSRHSIFQLAYDAGCLNGSGPAEDHKDGAGASGRIPDLDARSIANSPGPFPGAELESSRQGTDATVPDTEVSFSANSLF